MSNRNAFENLNFYGELFYLYRNLLTSKQQTICESYFDYDLSLREIATNLNISSSAVHDALKKTMKKLDEYEAGLHLFKKQSALNLLFENKNLTKEEMMIKIKEINDGVL